MSELTVFRRASLRWKGKDAAGLAQLVVELVMGRDSRVLRGAPGRMMVEDFLTGLTRWCHVHTRLADVPPLPSRRHRMPGRAPEDAALHFMYSLHVECDRRIGDVLVTMPPFPAALLWMLRFCDLSEPKLCKVLIPEWLGSKEDLDVLVREAIAIFWTKWRPQGPSIEG